MKFKVSNQSIIIRLFERVLAKDNQKDIFDIDIEHLNETIDSIVMGGRLASRNIKTLKQDKKILSDKYSSIKY